MKKDPFTNLKELKVIVGLVEALHTAAAGSGWTLDIRVAPTLTLEPKQSLFAKSHKAKLENGEPLEAGVFQMIVAVVDAQGIVEKEKVYQAGITAGLSRQKIGQRIRVLCTKKKIKLNQNRIMLMR